MIIKNINIMTTGIPNIVEVKILEVEVEDVVVDAEVEVEVEVNVTVGDENWHI